MKFEIELEEPTWPTYLRVRAKVKKTEDAKFERPREVEVARVDVGELDDSQVYELCVNFKAYCKKRKEVLKDGPR